MFEDGTFPRDADVVDDSDPTFASAIKKNRGEAPTPRQPRIVEPVLPVIDFAALTAERMRGKPRVEDLPF